MARKNTAKTPLTAAEKKRALIDIWHFRQTRSIDLVDDATLTDVCDRRGIPLVSSLTKGDVEDLCTKHEIELVDERHERIDDLEGIARHAARLVYTTDPRDHAAATAEIYHLFAKIGATNGTSAEMLLL